MRSRGVGRYILDCNQDAIIVKKEDIMKRKNKANAKTNESNRTAPVPREEEVIESLVMSADEMIPPEIALRDFRMQDGDYRCGFVDGISMMLLAARYNQILAASQAQIVKEQLEIYEKSKGSAAEIARQAAAEAAKKTTDEAVSRLAKEKPWKTSPDPLATMMADTLKPLFDNLVGTLTKPISTISTSGTTPPGFTEEEQRE